MLFLIQTVNNKIVHDFCFTPIQSIEYYNWLKGDENYMRYILSDKPNMNVIDGIELTPVGSVEFVHTYLQKYHNILDLNL